jgi:hypothetical protein
LLQAEVVDQCRIVAAERIDPADLHGVVAGGDFEGGGGNVEVAGVRRDEAPEHAAVDGDFEGLAAIVRAAPLGDGEHQAEFPRAEGDRLRRGGVHVLEEEHLVALGRRGIRAGKTARVP